MSLLLSLSLSLCFYQECSSVTETQRKSFHRELNAIAEVAPPYVKGGNSLKGTDCSGLLALAAKYAGMTDQRRTTALRMLEGMDGWRHNKLVDIDDSGPGDIVFWNMEKRGDHVGAVVLYKGLRAACHASWGKQKTVRVPFVGTLITKIDHIGRLK